MSAADSEPAYRFLTSQRSSLILTGARRQGATNPRQGNTPTCLVRSCVRVHLLSAWFQRGTGDS